VSWPRGHVCALLLGGLGVIGLSACEEGNPMESTMQMSLRSPAFEEGGSIPIRFTCDGEDISPPLSWSEEPEGTGSFVLIADDPDASGFVHWLLVDIPASVSSLAEGRAAGVGVAGRNDFRRSGWGGPCPPSGEHRYRFTLFAISGTLGLGGTPTEDEVRAAMQGRVLAQGQLTAMYRRAR
jgi:Raf kinase inhibitor-like YbhB/YbcL family protein